MSPRATSLLAKFFPVEAAPVVAPVVVAAVGFCAIITHVFVNDPDVNKGHKKLEFDCPIEIKKGEGHRSTVRSWFQERVRARHIGIFDNSGTV